MICHHCKCVFIHIPKNAGQSIEHVFLRLLDLTWETRAPLLLRYNDRPELGPPRLAHLRANEYVRYKYMTEEQFHTYFKFAFVRNPWDRMISIYKYLGLDKGLDFKTFLMKTLKNKIWDTKYWFVGPQSELICDENGELMVDFIGRFESLQEDFNQVCSKIGLPRTELPHVNKSEKINKVTLNPRWILLRPRKLLKGFLWQVKGRSIPTFESYEGYYDDESIEFVGKLYKRDIELFKYRFSQREIISQDT